MESAVHLYTKPWHIFCGQMKTQIITSGHAPGFETGQGKSSVKVWGEPDGFSSTADQKLPDHERFVPVAPRCPSAPSPLATRNVQILQQKHSRRFYLYKNTHTNICMCVYIHMMRHKHTSPNQRCSTSYLKSKQLFNCQTTLPGSRKGKDLPATGI